jgi:NAD(P)-dependent dehydrogenase (short-subunit alcohol dehydrogenase family)
MKRTRWVADDMPDQSGRTVLVTGASDGLGLATAEALAAKGAHVLLACRNPDKGQRARARVAEGAEGAAGGPGPDPTLVSLDLADLDSVRTCAEAVAGTVERLDVLVNNAGVMAVPFARTVDRFEVQLGTNHLGHYALTGLLLPTLLRAPAPRVVTVASSAPKGGRNRWDDVDGKIGRWPAYSRSKLANLLFAGELGRRAAAAGSGLVSAAAHPGYASTHLMTASVESSRSRIGGPIMRAATRVLGQSPGAGAWPQLYAATMPGVASGDYFGPDGPFEMRGHPTRVDMSSAAQDTAAAAQLWDLSAKLTGVTYDWDRVLEG